LTEPISDRSEDRAEQRQSVPRMLRAVTGVDEGILARIPTERARYTAMGGVVLGTALIAMVSMTVAIGYVLDGFPLFAAVFVVIWGAFILSMDRWLMSAATTANARQRALRLVPRLVLAIAVGTVVAEPLVLVTFGAEITEQADRERKAELRALESDLLSCNPVPGTAEERNSPVGTGRCTGLRLALSGTSVEGRRTQIADLEAQADRLEATVSKDSAAYAELEAEARRECNGTDGPGLSGRFGQGPNCRRLRAQADEYRSDHRIDRNTTTLAGIRTEIEKLTGRIGGDSDAFAAARKEAIATKIAEARERQDGLGLLERMRTLGHLTDQNGYAQAGEWALRIFLILIDALPVLVKFLSGFTTYDEIVADRLRQEKAGEVAVNKVRGNMRVLSAQLWQRSHEEQYRCVERQIQADGMRQLLAVEAAIEKQVDERADRLIGEAPTVTFTLPDKAATPARTHRAEPAPPPSQRRGTGWADRPIGPANFDGDLSGGDRMVDR
jgi:hypothetical protein